MFLWGWKLWIAHHMFINMESVLDKGLPAMSRPAFVAFILVGFLRLLKIMLNKDAFAWLPGFALSLLNQVCRNWVTLLQQMSSCLSKPSATSTPPLFVIVSFKWLLAANTWRLQLELVGYYVWLTRAPLFPMCPPWLPFSVRGHHDVHLACYWSSWNRKKIILKSLRNP